MWNMVTWYLFFPVPPKNRERKSSNFFIVLFKKRKTLLFTSVFEQYTVWNSGTGFGSIGNKNRVLFRPHIRSGWRACKNVLPTQPGNGLWGKWVAIGEEWSLMGSHRAQSLHHILCKSSTFINHPLPCDIYTECFPTFLDLVLKS